MSPSDRGRRFSSSGKAAKSRPSRDELREEHEDLYGALLAADQRIDDSGSGWLLFGAIFFAVGLVIGIEFEWFDRIFGLDLADTRHWAVYIGIGVVTFFAFGALVVVSETKAYRGIRDELHREAWRAGISWNVLLARTAKDESLKHVVQQMRKDRTMDDGAGQP